MICKFCLRSSFHRRRDVSNQFQTAFFMAMGQSTRVLIFQILWGYPMCNLVLWWLHIHIYSQPINVYQPRNPSVKKTRPVVAFGRSLSWWTGSSSTSLCLRDFSAALRGTCDAYRMRFASNSRGVQCASTVQLQSGTVYFICCAQASPEMFWNGGTLTLKINYHRFTTSNDNGFHEWWLLLWPKSVIRHHPVFSGWRFDGSKSVIGSGSEYITTIRSKPPVCHAGHWLADTIVCKRS